MIEMLNDLGRQWADVFLPALLQKLAERAERVLTGVAVSIERSPECPDCVVALTLKRHLIMYFKEVVHNCARHSKATQVRIAILVRNEIAAGFPYELIRAPIVFEIQAMTVFVNDVLGDIVDDCFDH